MLGVVGICVVVSSDGEMDWRAAVLDVLAPSSSVEEATGAAWEMVAVTLTTMVSTVVKSAVNVCVSVAVTVPAISAPADAKATDSPLENVMGRKAGGWVVLPTPPTMIPFWPLSSPLPPVKCAAKTPIPVAKAAAMIKAIPTAVRLDLSWNLVLCVLAAMLSGSALVAAASAGLKAAEEGVEVFFVGLGEGVGLGLGGFGAGEGGVVVVHFGRSFRGWFCGLIVWWRRCWMKCFLWRKKRPALVNVFVRFDL